MLQGLWRVKKEIMIQSTKAWRKEEFFLSREEQLFPQRLAAIPDAPYSLYVKELCHRSGIIRQWRSWGHAAVPLMAVQWQRRSQEGLLHLARGL